jgi:hypothetical protein
VNREQLERIGSLPHYVYRYYDADDTALYIGCTVDLKSRERSHREKLWWPMVARIETEELPNRSAALTLEQVYILRESPLFNVQHNRHHGDTSAASLMLMEKLARDPGGYEEFFEKVKDQLDLEPTPWDYYIRQRTERARTQRRLRASRARAQRIAEIKARRAS